MLAGRFKDFSIDDVFQLLTLTRKTGALRIWVDERDGGQATEARLHFVDGAVCLAAGDVRRAEVGERLVAAGHLSDEVLRGLAAEEPESASLGVVTRLLERGMVERSLLEEHVREAVHDTAAMLVDLDDASFTFDADLTARGWTGPGHAPADVLVEGRRRAAERKAAAEREPVPERLAPDSLLALQPTLPDERAEVTLTRDQWLLLVLVDGRRSAVDLAAAIDAEPQVVTERLADLVDLGLLVVSPAPEPEPHVAAASVAPEPAEAATDTWSRESGPIDEIDDVEAGADEHAEEPVPVPAVEPASAPDAPAATADVVPAPADPAEHAAAPTDAAEPSSAAADVVPAPVAEPAARPEAAHVRMPTQPRHTDDRGAPAAQPHGSRDDDSRASWRRPTFPRRDVNVDRSVMARELASLGLGDEQPLRRSVARPVARPSAEPAPPEDAARGAERVPAAVGAAPTNGSKAEHKLERDTRLNRGLLLRLIDGVRGI